tara:strand:- start:545 stop:1300 length:756 start_codon:yes stop_codon:yes gene_type:complete
VLAFWSCEQSDDDELQLVYSSIIDGESYNNYFGGALLKFSREISNEEFDAASIDDSRMIFANDSVSFFTIPFEDHMYFVQSSKYIQLNGVPQTFVYDSDNNSCLLIEITSEYLIDGTGIGFTPIVGSNSLKIGEKIIDFEINNEIGFSFFPNPYLAYNLMETTSYDKFVTFFNGDDENATIIDIYNTTNSDFIRRIDFSDGNAYCQWDLKDYNNEYIKSGIYSYRVGADTTGGGQLTSFKYGYVGIILPDD